MERTNHIFSARLPDTLVYMPSMTCIYSHEPLVMRQNGRTSKPAQISVKDYVAKDLRWLHCSAHQATYLDAPYLQERLRPLVRPMRAA